MTKTLLIATVAALAITAPAQAGPGDDRRAERAEKAEARKAQAQQVRPQRQERARVERPQRQQRVQAQRPQRQERVRMARPERQERARIERPQRQERVRMARPERQERVRVERPQRQERVRVERPQRQERVRVERPQRERVVERRSRNVERVRPQRAERQRVERQRPERVERQRVERQRDRTIERRSVERRPAIERQARVIEQRGGDRLATQRLRQQERQAERFARSQDRFERRQERIEMRNAFRERVADNRELQSFQQPSISVGERISVAQVDRDWFDDYATQRYSAFYGSSPDYFYDYNYDDGYLYRVDSDSYLVTAMFPLLGGAFGIGQALPLGYNSYNVPLAYRTLYYDTPYSNYRYGAGAIYQVDPTTQLISAIVALFTGQRLGVGSMLPLGYDVYNVPYQYRDMYHDTNDMWYRYDDGYIYGVDPYSRRIQTMYPVSYGGYAVGYPVPSYASYGGYTGYGGGYGGYAGYGGYPSYTVPYAYQNLYYGQPGYNYHYASNGIYQVDPTTQLISALVALVTGTNLGVGQMLPMGYDAYNVPYQYRANYYDTADSWYRYDDGFIYQVDPHSRMIQAAIPVAYNGYVVGQPIPAAYPGYAVPATYSDLYYEQPGYDYRYFDGGIYQVQPQTQVVVAPVALVTGHTLAVGQPLPMGYDVYNVPYAYRDRYYDNDRYMYRYADGHIYQVDPQTRLVQAVIDAIV